MTQEDFEPYYGEVDQEHADDKDEDVLTVDVGDRLYCQKYIEPDGRVNPDWVVATNIDGDMGFVPKIFIKVEMLTKEPEGFEPYYGEVEQEHEDDKDDDVLTVDVGDRLYCREYIEPDGSVNPDWVIATNIDGDQGIVPKNFIKKVTPNSN